MHYVQEGGDGKGFFIGRCRGPNLFYTSPADAFKGDSGLLDGGIYWGFEGDIASDRLQAGVSWYEGSILVIEADLNDGFVLPSVDHMLGRVLDLFGLESLEGGHWSRCEEGRSDKRLRGDFFQFDLHK